MLTILGVFCIGLGLLIFAAVFIAGSIRAWYHRRHPLQELPMPRARNHNHLSPEEGDPAPMSPAQIQDHLESERRLGDGGHPMVASPFYEPSINDYHKAREQDQSLNLLAMQLIDLQRVPWACMEIQELDPNNPRPGVVNLVDVVKKDNQNKPASSVLCLIRMLTAISQPIAVAGSSRNNSSDGDRHVVELNTVKLTCSTVEEMRRQTISINAKTFAVLLPVRRTILQEIKDHVTNVKPADTSAFRWCAYASANHCVLTRTREEAERITAALNQVYYDASAETRNRLLRDIEEWASKELEEMKPLFDGDGSIAIEPKVS